MDLYIAVEPNTKLAVAMFGNDSNMIEIFKSFEILKVEEHYKIESESILITYKDINYLVTGQMFKTKQGVYYIPKGGFNLKYCTQLSFTFLQKLLRI